MKLNRTQLNLAVERVKSRVQAQRAKQAGVPVLERPGDVGAGPATSPVGYNVDPDLLVALAQETENGLLEHNADDVGVVLPKINELPPIEVGNALAEYEGPDPYLLAEVHDPIHGQLGNAPEPEDPKAHGLRPHEATGLRPPRFLRDTMSPGISEHERWRRQELNSLANADTGRGKMSPKARRSPARANGTGYNPLDHDLN